VFFDIEEFLRFTGIRIREDLRAKIQAVTMGFVPGQPAAGNGTSPPGQAPLSGTPGFGSGIPGGVENLVGGAV